MKIIIAKSNLQHPIDYTKKQKILKTTHIQLIAKTIDL